MLYLRLTGAVLVVVVVVVVEVVVGVYLMKGDVEESKVVCLCVVGDIVNPDKEVDSVSCSVIATVLASVIATDDMVVVEISGAKCVAALTVMGVGAIVVVEVSIIRLCP